MRLSIFALALGVTACGTASKTAGGNSSGSAPAPSQDAGYHSMAVADSTALPTCDAKAEGWLVYLKVEKKFQNCAEGAWVDIDIGATANRIVASITCIGPLEGTATNIEYNVDEMSSGDVFVHGGVRSTSFGIYGSNYYAATQQGSATGALLIEDDLMAPNNGGYWTLTLDRNSLITSVLYTDADVSGGSQTWTMTPNKCILNKY